MDQISERRNRLADALVDQAGPTVTPATLALAASTILRLDAASINIAGLVGPVVVGCNGPLAHELEDLQRRLGEGPTLTALEGNGSIIVLDVPGGLGRWPVFSPEAVETGITALFALPLRPRSYPSRALSLYTTATDLFDNARIGDVLLVADLIAEALVDPSRDGLRQRLGQVGDDRSAVHHATGHVAARHQLSPAEALSSIRKQAATANTSVAKLATRVINPD